MILERLTSPRLTLEPLSLDVGRRLLTGDRSAVRAGAGWPHEDTLDGVRMGVETGAPLAWLVEEGGLVIGDVGLHGPPDPTGRVEIGYGLAAPFRGRGLATEAVAAMVAWLLGQPAVTMVVAHTLPDNTASRRVLEKTGFEWRGEEEGEMRYERRS